MVGYYCSLGTYIEYYSTFHISCLNQIQLPLSPNAFFQLTSAYGTQGGNMLARGSGLY